MQILSRTHVQKVRFLLPNLNYKNVGAVLQGLLPDDLDSLFGKVNVAGDEAVWTVDDSLSYRSLDKATQDEQEEVAEVLDYKKSAIINIIRNNPQIGGFAKELFTVPSNENIHFARTATGEYKVVLSQWGMTLKTFEANNDVISSLLKMPRKSFYSNQLKVEYNDGVSADNVVVDICFYEEPKSFKTDYNGIINLGRLKRNISFLVEKDGISQTFVTAEDDKEFVFRIPRYTSARITVLNQNNEPMEGYALVVEGVNYTTDTNGIIETQKFEFYQDRNLDIKDPTGFVIGDAFKLEWDEAQNNFIYKIVERIVSFLKITVVYTNGEVAADYPVTVQNKANMESHEYLTDMNGIVHIEDLIAGDELSVIDGKNASILEALTLHRGCNECTLVVEKERIKMVRIRLLNRDDSVMEGVNLKVKLKSGEVECTTDSEGCVYIPATNFADGEKVQLEYYVLNKNVKPKRKKHEKTGKKVS